MKQHRITKFSKSQVAKMLELEDKVSIADIAILMGERYQSVSNAIENAKRFGFRAWSDCLETDEKLVGKLK